MGTFTFSYLAKTAVWDKRGYLLACLGAAYIATCWENAGKTKAEMMKVSKVLHSFFLFSFVDKFCS